jgi:luciferase-type oxidoreductase
METSSPQGQASVPGFRRMFASNRLTLGLFFPLAAYAGDMPDLAGQAELAAMADKGGFSALWTRDVPLQDPTFGDLGQVIDPFVWMGYMLNHVKQATFATGSLILPLRHPIHIAKAAAFLDNLSSGRFVMGVASGDRPVEFPAFGKDLERRGEVFRESLAYIKSLLENEYPTILSELGRLQGANLQPKPLHGSIPIGVTGGSQQSHDWIARNTDFWVTYPRPLGNQAHVLRQWRALVQEAGYGYEKPVAQSLYIDLTEDAKQPSRPIHLGFRLGRESLLDLLQSYRSIGVNHVAFVLKFSSRPIANVIQELSEEIVPHFPAIQI